MCGIAVARARHDLHVPIIERLRSRATSEPLDGSYAMHIRRICGGSAGVRGGSAPDAGRFRRARSSRRGSPPRWCCALAARRSAHARSRGAGLPRRPVRTHRVRRLGRALVRRVTPCPATACCFRRSPRCSGCALARGLLGARLGGAVRALGRSACTAASARWGAVWFAVAAVGDIWIGRLTFALGVTFAACRRAGARPRASPLGRAAGGAVRGRQPRRGRAAGARRRSPHALARRSPRALLVLALPAAVVVVRARAAVPRRRLRAVPDPSFAATALVTLRVPLGAARAGARLLRIGGVVYLLACVLRAARCTRRWAATSSATRVLLAGPLLLCALASASREPAGRLGAWGRPVALLALAVFMRCGAPCARRRRWRGTNRRAPPTTRPSCAFLAVRGPGRPARAGRGAAHALALGGRAAGADRLARARLGEAAGRALRRRAAQPGLTAAGYSRWLHEQAVSYVALPDTPLDPSSAQEGRLIRRGLPYLRVVFSEQALDGLRGARPDAAAGRPGRLISLGHDSFALRAASPGRFLVRVSYTPLSGRSPRVAAASHKRPAGWTSVTVRAPGTVIVAARFSLARALGLAAPAQRVPPVRRLAPIELASTARALCPVWRSACGWRAGNADAPARRTAWAAAGTQRRSVRWLIAQGEPPRSRRERRAAPRLAPARAAGPARRRSARPGRGLRGRCRRSPPGRSQRGLRERARRPHGHGAGLSHGLVSGAAAGGLCSAAGRCARCASRPARIASPPG